MIKTTSFAPPRARPARASGRKIAAPRTNPLSAPARALAPVAQTSTAKMPRQSSKTTPDTAQFSLFGENESEPTPEKVEAKTSVTEETRKAAPKKAEDVAKAPVAEAKTRKTPAKLPKVVAETPEGAAQAPKIEAPAPEVVAQAPKKAKSTTPRVKRVKIPDNLGEQYGESASKRADSAAIPILEPETPKKRLTKVERQARRDLMRPDEVMARLKRLNDLPVRKAPVEKREKGWKFECGRCGKTSYFQTPGGICNCGALAIRE
jgi:hypothetical protein